MAEFDSVIPPGGVGQVTAEVHTDKFKGAIAKSVTVTSDDPTHPTTRLTIRALVTVAVDVEPRDYLTATGQIGKIEPLAATVFAVGGEAFDVLSIKARSEMLTVAVEPVATPAAGSEEPAAKPAKKDRRKTKDKETAAGQTPAESDPLASGASRYRLTISPTDKVPPGRSVETVTVLTNHPKGAEVPIRISFSLTGPVSVRPERLDLRVDAAKPGVAPMGTVVLTKAEGDPLAIQRVSATNPAFAPTVRTVEEGRVYAIDVRYDEQAAQRTVTGQLVITTNVPEQPSVTIPLVGRR